MHGSGGETSGVFADFPMTLESDETQCCIEVIIVDQSNLILKSELPREHVTNKYRSSSQILLAWDQVGRCYFSSAMLMEDNRKLHG